MESWRRKPRRGILKKDSLRRNLRGGILEVPAGGIMETPDSPEGASRGTPDPPRISPKPPRPLSGLRGKVC